MTTLEPPTKAKATESFLCMPPDRHNKKEEFRLTQRAGEQQQTQHSGNSALQEKAELNTEKTVLLLFQAFRVP